MKVLFAFPCQKRYLKDPSMSILPIGLLSMAAVLEQQGHDVTLVHLARYAVKDGIRLILSYQPDVVGLSCFSFQRHRTLELAQRLKEQGVPWIFLGGPHAVPLAKEVLEHCPAIDGVVTGEGETIMPALLERLTAGKAAVGPGVVVAHSGLTANGLSNENADGGSCDGSGIDDACCSRVAELDTLPSLSSMNVTMLGIDERFQRRHLLTGRGCGAACTFCYAPKVWPGAVRRHSVARVISDVEQLRHRYGLQHVSFRDDSFTSNRTWTLELCRALAELDIQWDCQSRMSALDAELVDVMRVAGCVHIQLGLESASEPILRRLGKALSLVQARQAVESCRQAALPFSLYLIYGVPGEGKADIQATSTFVRWARPASVSISALAYYPGTALAKDVPNTSWFEDTAESLLVRRDKGAARAGARLQRLADECRARDPYTEVAIAAAGDRLGWPPVLFLARARLLESQDRNDEARQCLVAGLNDFPHHPWLMLERGALSLDCGEIDAALVVLEKLVEAQPRWPYALDRLGWALRLSGDEEHGEQARAEARRLHPFADPPLPPRWVLDDAGE